MDKGISIVNLAEKLYYEMERLDPSDENTVPWENISSMQRHFYWASVLALLGDKEKILSALNDLADDSDTFRSAKTSENSDGHH